MNYYEIAKNDLEYLEASKHIKPYNGTVIQCQQVAEKLLKHLVVQFCAADETAERVLRSHSLRLLNNYLGEAGINLGLDRKTLKTVGDYYFDARYPGDDYELVPEEDKDEALRLVDSVKRAVKATLQSKDYCLFCGESHTKCICGHSSTEDLDNNGETKGYISKI